MIHNYYQPKKTFPNQRFGQQNQQNQFYTQTYNQIPQQKTKDPYLQFKEQAFKDLRTLNGKYFLRCLEEIDSDLKTDIPSFETLRRRKSDDISCLQNFVFVSNTILNSVHKQMLEDRPPCSNMLGKTFYMFLQIEPIEENGVITGLNLKIQDLKNPEASLVHKMILPLKRYDINCDYIDAKLEKMKDKTLAAKYKAIFEEYFFHLYWLFVDASKYGIKFDDVSKKSDDVMEKLEIRSDEVDQ